MIHAIKNSSSATIEHGTAPPTTRTIPRHELRVPLGMSRIHPAIPVDRTLASALFRDAPEDDEEDEDEKKDNEEEDEEGEREGYSE